MNSTIKSRNKDLKEFVPKHDNFIGIDSDGCVFDSMTFKQKECFHGLIVSHWQLEPIEKIVRECAEFVNLYSRWRGQNRFISLSKSFEFLHKRPDIIKSGIKIPKFETLKIFLSSAKTLSNEALREHAEQNQDPQLFKILSWSLAVNAEIEKKSNNIVPFEWAVKSLSKIQNNSDVVCISQTPTEALVREWTENKLENYVALIAGQELGTKTNNLIIPTLGKYKEGRVLMIGDADGDRKAANTANALFYPINPGKENASWQRFHDEAYHKFLAGQYSKQYEAKLNNEFNAFLPSKPPWDLSSI